MAILKYSEAMQKALSLKVKPEPWLHIIVERSTYSRQTVLYAVYVWDTREVIDSGGLYIEPKSSKAKAYDDAKSKSTSAVDNHQPLKARIDDSVVFSLNQAMQKTTSRKHSTGTKQVSNDMHREQIDKLMDGVRTFLHSPAIDGWSKSLVKDLRANRKYATSDEQRQFDRVCDMYRDMKNER